MQRRHCYSLLKATVKVWCTDYRDRVWTDAAMRDLRRFRGLNLLRGVELSDSFPQNAVVEIRTRREPTDFLTAGSFWILSERLKGLLDSHRVQAEYFDVRLERRTGSAVRGSWSCFNPTLVMDWFDRATSKFVAERDFATEIETVRADLARFGQAPLAVAAKTIPILVGVSDSLAEAIRAAGCTGVVFRSPEEWTNPVNPIRESEP